VEVEMKALSILQPWATLIAIGDNGIVEVTGSITTIELSLCKAWLIVKESEK
jgi:hypothetical protein